jgi:hypothetical protein
MSLMETMVPDILIADGVCGNHTLMDIVKGRHVLGSAAQFTWREVF